MAIGFLLIYPIFFIHLLKKNIVSTEDALRDNNTYVYHRKIVEAIAHHDAQSAYNAMMIHVTTLREFIVSKLDTKEK